MNRKKLYQEIGSSLFFLALCVLLWFVIIPWGIPLRGTWAVVSYGMNTRSFPFFTVAVMGIASLCVLGKSLFLLFRLTRKEKDNAPGEKFRLTDELKVVGFILLFVLYAVLFKYAGFIIATILVPPAILFFLGNRKILHYLCVYGVGIGFYLIFRFLLYVLLP